MSWVEAYLLRALGCHQKFISNVVSVSVSTTSNFNHKRLWHTHNQIKISNRTITVSGDEVTSKQGDPTTMFLIVMIETSQYHQGITLRYERHYAMMISLPIYI